MDLGLSVHQCLVQLRDHYRIIHYTYTWNLFFEPCVCVKL